MVEFMHESIVFCSACTRHCKGSLRSLYTSPDEFLVLVLLLLLPSLLGNVAYVKKQLPNIFAQLLQKTQFGTLYAWNVAYRLLHYINIVYSKVLQALSIILTNQCDMSKQVITI